MNRPQGLSECPASSMVGFGYNCAYHKDDVLSSRSHRQNVVLLRHCCGPWGHHSPTPHRRPTRQGIRICRQSIV